MTDPPLRLQIPASLDALSTTRTILRSVLPEMELDQTSLFLGAVTEVLTNAIAASADADEPTVEVAFTATPSPRITVTDRGTGFDQTLPTPGPRKKRLGQGLRIARSVVPGLTIHSDDSGTVVVIPIPTSEIPTS